VKLHRNHKICVVLLVVT